MGKVKDPDPRSLNAIAVARRYALGEATEQELASASDDVYAACNAAYYAAASYAAAYDAHASTAACNAAYYAAAYASTASTAACNTAYYATSYDPTASYEVKAILIKMINDLTELERLML